MSLYEQMKKDRSRIFTVGKDFVAKSRLLDDFKAGKEPEKKHKTLDQFFKDSQIKFNVLM